MRSIPSSDSRRRRSRPKQKIALWQRLRPENREGIVFKRLDAPYTPGKPNSGGPQLKFKFCATLSAVVAKVNTQRSVEIRLLNGDGWIPCGNVTIPANHKIPKVGAGGGGALSLRLSRKAARCISRFIWGREMTLTPGECLVSQLKYKAEEESC